MFSSSSFFHQPTFVVHKHVCGGALFPATVGLALQANTKRTFSVQPAQVSEQA